MNLMGEFHATKDQNLHTYLQLVHLVGLSTNDITTASVAFDQLQAKRPGRSVKHFGDQSLIVSAEKLQKVFWWTKVLKNGLLDKQVANIDLFLFRETCDLNNCEINHLYINIYTKMITKSRITGPKDRTCKPYQTILYTLAFGGTALLQEVETTVPNSQNSAHNSMGLITLGT